MPNIADSCVYERFRLTRCGAKSGVPSEASVMPRLPSATRSPNCGDVINPIARATALVIAPRRAWRTIVRERPTFFELLFGYVVPFALIGPVATYLALRVLGVPIARGQLYRTSQPVAFGSAAQTFAFELGGVFLIAALITLLAPAFGAARDFRRAFAIAAYAYTPLWLASILSLVPRVATLQLVAAGDALVLLVLGLVAMVGTSPRRAVVFAAVVVTAAFACGYLVGVTSAVVRGPDRYVGVANSR